MAADGALGVLRVDEVKKLRRDGHRQFGVGQARALGFRFGEIRDVLLQLLQRGDAVFELPLPVVPICIGHAFPRAESGGVELLEFAQPIVMWQGGRHVR